MLRVVWVVWLSVLTGGSEVVLKFVGGVWDGLNLENVDGIPSTGPNWALYTGQI